MEQYKRNIPPPAITKVYHFILFGDLSMAGLVHPIVVEKKDTYEFYFIPTPTMRFKYQIQDWEYDKAKGCIVKEYTKDQCFRASDYPIGWIILSDYNKNHLENDFVSKINRIILETNKELNREIQGYRMLLPRQSWEHLQMIKHPQEAWKKSLEQMKDAKDVVGTTQTIISEEEEKTAYEQR